MTVTLFAARLGVGIAIGVTLWFNGSYAWSKADGTLDRLGLVALALAVDCCKSGFLPAASYFWQTRARLRAAMLVVLWVPSLMFSTFCGYAAITANRSATSVAIDGKADTRARAQQTYTRATADIAAAMASPLWQSSAACTAIKKAAQSFCANVADLKAQQAAASAILDATPPATSNPELALVTATTGLPLPIVTLLVAAWPAILLELVASIGFYAIQRHHVPEASRKAVEGLFKKSVRHSAPTPESAPTAHPEASATPSLPVLKGTPTTPKQIQWNI